MPVALSTSPQSLHSFWKWALSISVTACSHGQQRTGACQHLTAAACPKPLSATPTGTLPDSLRCWSTPSCGHDTAWALKPAVLCLTSRLPKPAKQKKVVRRSSAGHTHTDTHAAAANTVSLTAASATGSNTCMCQIVSSAHTSLHDVGSQGTTHAKCSHLRLKLSSLCNCLCPPNADKLSTRTACTPSRVARLTARTARTPSRAARPRV